MFVCVRERETETERDRQRQTETDRDREKCILRESRSDLNSCYLYLPKKISEGENTQTEQKENVRVTWQDSEAVGPLCDVCVCVRSVHESTVCVCVCVCV